MGMNANRENIKKDHPGLSVTEFGKKAGEIWKEMSDKSEWEEKAREDKKRYEAEMEKWRADGGEEKLKAAKKAAKRAEKAASSPKKKAGGGVRATRSAKSKADKENEN